MHYRSLFRKVCYHIGSSVNIQLIWDKFAFSNFYFNTRGQRGKTWKQFSFGVDIIGSVNISKEIENGSCFFSEKKTLENIPYTTFHALFFMLHPSEYMSCTANSDD